MNRRSFLYQTGVSGLVASSGMMRWDRLLRPDITKLTILHTNDQHSRVEAFPNDGSRNAGLGGAAKRSALIQQIRAEADHVLLLDAGDIFQGTPYFNFFGGEVEMKLMTQMGYDAATIGNHDFDGGMDGLAKAQKWADFPLVVANYDFSNTVMHDRVEPYIVKEVGGLRVGIFGLGIELNGLVPQDLYLETQYLDPISTGQRTAHKLRYELGCDYVVCLSHLGYAYRENPDRLCDRILARETEDIDLVIGGHTHTFMKAADIQKNKAGKEVIINQAGWAGILLGRIDIFFEKNRPGKCVSCKNTFVK